MKPKLRTWLVRLMFFAFCLVAVEIASKLVYRIYKGRWYWADRRTPPQGMIIPHPFLGTALAPELARVALRRSLSKTAASLAASSAEAKSSGAGPAR